MFAPKRALSVLRVLIAASCLASCAAPLYFTRSASRPLPGLLVRNGDLGSTCLMVMLPGLLDGPDTFLDHDFPRRLFRSGSHCDALAVDFHINYYGSATPQPWNVILDDVISVAQARGYEEIWLTGISMGGLSALLTAAHSDAITGIILMSPFVGDRVVRQVRSSGIADWEAPRRERVWTEAEYEAQLWRWIQGYAHGEHRPPLYLGWGDRDRSAAADQVLATALADDHVVIQPGEHNWTTWEPLYEELLRRARPGH